MSSARIKIYKYQYGKVDGRRVETEPILYHECWCEIGSLYGKELYKAIEIRLEDTIVFDNVRYCKKVKEIAAHLKDYFVEYEGESTTFCKGLQTERQAICTAEGEPRHINVSDSDTGKETA